MIKLAAGGPAICPGAARIPPSPPMQSEKTASALPGWLILMGALTAIGPLSIDMYLPAFPAIADSLSASHGEVERTLAAYLIGLALAQVFYGPLADRYGRKLPLCGALVLYVVASVGGALAQDVDSLAAWRVLQAIGGAAGVVIPRAVIRDHFDVQDSARALSSLMLIMGIAPILAPLIGGQLLGLTGWRGIFWLMAALGALLLAFVVKTMRESLAPERVIPLSAATIARNYAQLISHRRFVAFALAGGLGSAGMFSYIVASPRVFIEYYGVPPEYYGLLFGTNAAGLIIGSQCSARLLRRHAPDRVLRRALPVLAGFPLVALALTLAGWITLPLLMACIVGYMSTQGFVNPNSAALALADQGGRLGAASALMGTLQLGCGALAGLAVSAWQTPTALPLAAMLALCGCLSWLAGRIALAKA